MVYLIYIIKYPLKSYGIHFEFIKFIKIYGIKKIHGLFYLINW